MKNEKKMCEIE